MAFQPRPPPPPRPPPGAPRPSEPSLLGTATSPTILLLSFAALVLGGGYLARRSTPKHRDRAAGAPSKPNKVHDKILRKISLAQEEAAAAALLSERTGKPELHRVRSASTSSSGAATTSGRGRSPSTATAAASTLVASTSSSIVHGIASLSNAAVGAIASTSSTKTDAPTPSTSRTIAVTSPSSEQQPSSSTTSEVPSMSSDAFGTATGNGGLSVEQPGKKGKGKKGKATVASPSQGATSSSAPSTSLSVSPARTPLRRPMKDVGVLSDLPSTSTVSVQTFLTFPQLATIPCLVPLPTRDEDDALALNAEPGLGTTSEPPSEPIVEETITELEPVRPTPNPPVYRDATVQTLVEPKSPSPATRPLLRPFDLHASFQSTPPASTASSSHSQPYPLPSSPPLSPSRSRRASDTSSHSPSRSLSPSLRPTPSSSSNASPSTSRSRKQRKSAAIVNNNASVVGLVRPSRSREPTGESVGSTSNVAPPLAGATGGGGGTTSVTHSPTPVQGKLLSPVEERRGSSPEEQYEEPVSTKGKEREFSSSVNGTAMGTGKGRYGIPAPIPIPATADSSSSSSRRMSSSTTSASTSATSPHLSHQILMTMTPPPENLRRPSTTTMGGNLPPVGASTAELEAFWRGEGLVNGGGDVEGWRGGNGNGSGRGGTMGLAIDLDSEGREVRGKRVRGSGTRNGGKSAAEDRRSSAGRSSWASDGVGGGGISPGMGPPDGFFAQQAYLVGSPDSSPLPSHRQILSQQPRGGWTPQLMASQYTMMPYPPGPPSASTPNTAGPPPSSQHQHPSSSSSQSRPSSRQSSLSVPPSTAQTQQAAHLQQQQAYAFYVQAQAQYQHVLALQIQASEMQQRQQQARRQRQESDAASTTTNPNTNNNSSSSSGRKPSLVTSGLVYPISSSSPATGWSSHSNPASPTTMIPSYAQPPPPPAPSSTSSRIPHSISPTSGTFPTGLPANYYLASPPPPYPSANGGFPFVGGASSTNGTGVGAGQVIASTPNGRPGMPRNSSNASSSNGGKGSREPRGRASPRLSGGGAVSSSAEKSRSGSIVSTSTSNQAATTGGTTDPWAWKVKVRTAEMDADRSAKELEIARWRLAVLEEEQRMSELENHAALSALATRAMRAEARIKLLEEARAAHDSSSASGSASPVTRPSSIAGSTELPPISTGVGNGTTTSCVEEGGDPVRLDSPPGVKVHPLAWLDLDSISFGTPRPLTNPNSVARPTFPFHSTSSNSLPRRKGRNYESSASKARRLSGQNGSGGNSPSMNGSSGQRRRSSAAFGAGGERSRESPSLSNLSFDFEDEEEDDEVLIVLDSPLRRKSPAFPPSGAGGGGGEGDELQQQHQHHHHHLLVGASGALLGAELEGLVDDDEISNLDVDEVEIRSARSGSVKGEWMEDSEVEWVGSLPTRLTQGGSTTMTTTTVKVDVTTPTGLEDVSSSAPIVILEVDDHPSPSSSDDEEEDHDRLDEEEEEDDDDADEPEQVPPQDTSAVSIPSFILDCATPSPSPGVSTEENRWATEGGGVEGDERTPKQEQIGSEGFDQSS